MTSPKFFYKFKYIYFYTGLVGNVIFIRVDLDNWNETAG